MAIPLFRSFKYLLLQMSSMKNLGRDIPSALNMSTRLSSRSAAYAHAKTGGFSLEPPQLHNPYRDDPVLDRTLRRLLSQKEYEVTARDLDRFGDRVVREVTPLGRQCELNEPELVAQDAWGRRTDQLKVCDEWKKIKRILAEEGLVAIGYDCNRDVSARRIHQTTKLLLFGPSSGLVSCPLAMTDGAARTFEALGLTSQAAVKEAFDRLTSRDPDRAWTSGQWMTEKRGGSDVGGATDTYATHVSGDTYRLNGYKWFSSAIDADMALTLARIVDKEGKAPEGTKGLSLFLVKLRNDEGQLNGIQMIRLKDKLGTRQLPTAELLLDGVEATLLSPSGRGVSAISNMLNVTRVHNAAASVGYMRRMLSLARDYSARRSVFGRLQKDWPLHTSTLAELEVETRACTLFLLNVSRLVGLAEAGKATVEEALTVRLLTPVLKAYTAKVCVPLVSEGLECFGGMGYMEDTGIPAILRDAQVTPIWEGTTNVLSLDVLRVMAGRENVAGAFASTIQGLLAGAQSSTNARVVSCARAVTDATIELGKVLKALAEGPISGETRIDVGARLILMAIARIYCGALLTNAAAHADASVGEIVAAERFCKERSLLGSLSVESFKHARIEEDRALVYENFTPNSKL